MLCDECKTPTHVIETFTDVEQVHRLRQCPKCKWMCNTLETYIEEAYRPSSVMRRKKRQAKKEST